MKPESPQEPVDPRHRPIFQYIAQKYAESNQGLKVPWTGRTGTILKKILKANPSWPLQAFLTCVDNRFASDNVNVAQSPDDWLDTRHARLVNYALAPLDCFGRPKPRARVRPPEPSGFDSAYDYFVRQGKIKPGETN